MDSLVATRIVAVLRSRFGVDIPLRSVFEFPVLGEFAESVVPASPTPAAGTPGRRPTPANPAPPGR
ncbi:acyl carrier protein [Streptomyces sp. IMTB 2501]|uniref:acyl carrier protein n=1 Tax=Streptomyces sp. IMTB 2501 TaxID=1776340 RepID=UPI0035325B8E